MNFTLLRRFAAGLLAALCVGGASAKVVGVKAGDPGTAGTATAPVFNLVAADGYVSAADGGSIYNWGYGIERTPGTAAMQYPGPTLIVNQGDVVTIRLRNTLPVATSMVFPGQTLTSVAGGTAGVVTTEAGAGATVSYTFTAAKPGTYLYHSGTAVDLQTEMGLVGTLVVRPTGFSETVAANRRAYNHADTRFDREVLALITEIDPVIHDTVRQQVDEIRASTRTVLSVDMTQWKPVYWFLNGRTAPDTFADNDVVQLPAQPYNCTPRMRAGERLLLRVVNAGRDLHPMHHHGNNSWTIARDGRVLSSNSSAAAPAPDLAQSDYTVKAVPGQTTDAIYQWTGAGLNWDISGRADSMCGTGGLGACPSPPPGTAGSTQLPTDNKPFPVAMPGALALSYGEYYSGSPYLGFTGARPVGTGLGNGGGFYTHMFHSHNEKEIVNNDIFPGGLIAMIVIESPLAVINE